MEGESFFTERKTAKERKRCFFKDIEYFSERERERERERGWEEGERERERVS